MKICWIILKLWLFECDHLNQIIALFNVINRILQYSLISYCNHWMLMHTAYTFCPVMTCWKWTSQAESLSSFHYPKAKISNITAHKFQWFRAGWLVYKAFLVAFLLTLSYVGVENLALRTTNTSIYECIHRPPWLWSSHCQVLCSFQFSI